MPKPGADDAAQAAADEQRIAAFPPPSSQGTSTVTTAADISLDDLRKLQEEFNQARPDVDGELIALIHYALGPERPTLEVILDGRPYLSIRTEGKVLVIDRLRMQQGRYRALSGVPAQEKGGVPGPPLSARREELSAPDRATGRDTPQGRGRSSPQGAESPCDDGCSQGRGECQGQP